jgi:serine/threonine protein kinase
VYLKSKNVLHRDLKLANLFITRTGDIKIGDLGLACIQTKAMKKRKSVCGTPNYIAPEILLAEGYSFPADVWAAGVLLYSLLIGHPPFETSTISLTYKRIENCIYMFPPEIKLPICVK